MKEERDIEEFQGGHRARLRQKLEKQIKRVEGIIEELLEGVVISELTSKDRLMMAARFSSVYHHAIMIDDNLEAHQEEERENMRRRERETKTDAPSSGVASLLTSNR